MTKRLHAEWLHVKIPISDDPCNPSLAEPCWWKIHIQTDSGAAHDRTTWAARVSGDPVRLVD